jgi:hypothetical protein
MELNELLDRDYPLYYAYWIRCIHKPNNMGYVGIRKSKTPHPKDDKYWGSSTNKEFKEDFKKYGESGFEKTIISWSASKDVIREREVIFIDWCGTLIPNGYNIHPAGGGRMGVGVCQGLINKYGAEDAKEKIKEVGKKISATKKQRYAEGKFKMPSGMGFGTSNKKCTIGGVEYNSITQASKETNILRSKLYYLINKYGINVLDEVIQREKNHVLLKEKRVNRKLKSSEYGHHRSMCVILGKQYESLRSAAKELGKSRNVIYYWLRDRKDGCYYINKTA